VNMTNTEKILVALGMGNILMFSVFSLIVYSVKIENRDIAADVSSYSEAMVQLRLDHDLLKVEVENRTEAVDVLLKKKAEQILTLEESIDAKDKRWAKIKLVRKAVEDTAQARGWKLDMGILDLTAYASAVVEASEEFDVPIPVILAVTTRESRFNPKAVSIAGALGAMQLMPKTADECARELGLKGYNFFIAGVHNPLFNVKINVRLGTYYLSKMIRRFGEFVELYARAYNAGPEYVDKHFLIHREDLWKEPREYAPAVAEWKKLYENFGL
jgi:hypothetical protein